MLILMCPPWWPAYSGGGTHRSSVTQSDRMGTHVRWIPPWRAPADLMRRKRIKRGELVDVRLTPQERDLILERTLIDGEMEGRLRGATPRGSNLVVQLALDDVDDLAGHVAAKAYHYSEPRVRRVLDAVYDRLANLEHTFTDDWARPKRSSASRSRSRRSRGSISRTSTTTRRSTGGHRPNRICSDSSESRHRSCIK